MSELPNLIWAFSDDDGDATGGWVVEMVGQPSWAAPYVPASELEQARDRLAECGEEIARLREALFFYAETCDASETGECLYNGQLCCRKAREALGMRIGDDI